MSAYTNAINLIQNRSVHLMIDASRESFSVLMGRKIMNDVEDLAENDSA